MPERGLPLGIKMRHDSHYVDELTHGAKSVGKVIKIDRIEPNPDQPRTEIGDLTELAASIEKQGVLEPLLVKPREDGTYMIIAGERRWRASNLAGLKEVPCIELDIDENTIAEIALVENLQRKDLTIWEVAEGLAALTERFGYTHDDIAEKIGKSRSTVTESIAIAGLPSEIKDRCKKADITAKSVLIEITRQYDETSMHKLLDEIQNKDLNRTVIREKAKVKKTGPLKPIKDVVGAAAAETVKEEEVQEPATEPETANNFTYEAAQGNFELTISFESEDEFTRKDVLIALKEAFDAVKSGAVAEPQE